MVNNDNKNKPILGRGEVYVQPHTSKGSFSRDDFRPSFEDACVKLSGQLDKVLSNIDATDKEFLLDEIVVNMRMDPNYSAKSYHPTSLIKNINAKELGSKKWTKEVISKKKNRETNTRIGKEIFLKMSRTNLETLNEHLKNKQNFTKRAQDNLRSIDSIFFDTHSNLIDKFGSDWKEGKVEFVLHPFEKDSKIAIDYLLKLITEFGGDTSKIKYKTYSSGITFISAQLNINTLKQVIKYNPIRTVHPINFKSVPIIRSGGGTSLPLPPEFNHKSTVKVGVFDGGINDENLYLNPFVTEYNPIGTKKNDDFISHGTGVVGAILYGDLSKYNLSSNLPTPIINVESYRLFPTSDPYDEDLYEAIDKIEDIVPKRKNDIKVFNLSIGPYGAIDDDNITRFTYALDELSKDGDVLFVVAVGNDGNLPMEELCRIQAPSDSVNNLGVGSYTKNDDGSISRADYSSYGDGREGCKIKPDFLDFGGDDSKPFQLISIDGTTKNFSAGTSFAAPLVSAKAAELIARCNLADPLLAKTLLIHNATHPNNDADKYIGHGYAKETVDDILYCEGNKVTTIYQHKLAPTESIKLPLPLVKGLDYKGTIIVEYTIALATGTDAKNSEDYTLTCIEDTFYPHCEKYKFEKTVNSKKKTKQVLFSETEKMKQLLDEGWKQSKGPIPNSEFNNKYKTEEERKQNFKWDTVIKRITKPKKYSSFKDPYLVLHAMERFESNTNFVNFAIAVTITYLDCEENVYDLTLKQYNQLEVSQVRAANKILIDS